MKKPIPPAFNGVKRLGCMDDQCVPCAHVHARVRAFGPANVFVAVTPSELDIIAKTKGLTALWRRVVRASVQCEEKRR